VLPRRIAGIDVVEAATDHPFAHHTHEQFGIGLIHEGAHVRRLIDELVAAIRAV